MLDFFNKKNDTLMLYRPVAGKLIDICQVRDYMFSSKVLGDGVAIEPDGETIVSPCDGKVAFVPKTLHAVALEAHNGVEILIHIGIDTVELGGQGFTCHVEAGNSVRKGDKLISFDKAYIEGAGKSLTTPIVITNAEDKSIEIKKCFENSEDIIIELMVEG